MHFTSILSKEISLQLPNLRNWNDNNNYNITLCHLLKFTIELCDITICIVHTANTEILLLILLYLQKEMYSILPSFYYIAIISWWFEKSESKHLSLIIRLRGGGIRSFFIFMAYLFRILVPEIQNPKYHYWHLFGDFKDFVGNLKPK